MDPDLGCVIPDAGTKAGTAGTLRLPGTASWHANPEDHAAETVAAIAGAVAAQ